ncbi:large-conductance mechanosensitive channel protein MscL [Yanshouia hominis]|uniref:Large-conductance mechanosensitive channel n=1 Tax=Yanshouia hominis TaxID=2763673 RepID=A0ABR7NHY5_9FIRM|nr:large-conductance mechanosensitive channel protein MscL [Yanshouia hominis]MBC8575985.1 large-conductance mechanosensitive channel protein MscL [Yanshouia hominis]
MAGSGKGFLAEFKEFISRGNVVDMAVGVVVGSAFTGIVNSLVKDVMMPAIGFLIGGIDFADLKIVLAPAVGETPEVAVLYGTFLNQIVNFLILAFVVFVMVRMLNRFHRKKEEAPAAPAAPPADIVLLTEIRDLLKEKEKK